MTSPAQTDCLWQPHPGPQTQALASSAFELMYGGSAGGGKRLRVDEPIPTPSGWTTMGALRVGDLVFDAEGQPTRVTWCSAAALPSEAWELTFSDGTTMEADAEHQWLTLTDAERLAQLHRTPEWRAQRRAKRPGRAGGNKSARFTAAISERNARLASAKKAAPPKRGTVKTTAVIVETLRKGVRSNHCVVNPAPLQLAGRELPIPPYVLGAWLGDGTSANGGLTCLDADAEIPQRVAAEGYRVVRGARLRWGVHGLHVQLRAQGLLRNKHIPLQYLRASLEQRLALLQGLCDTGGHCTEKGSVEFTTTTPALRDGMLELLATLGIKPSCSEANATIAGRIVSKKWRIQFFTALPAFSLARKLKRQKRTAFRGTHDARYIVAARRVAPTPMRCIAVEAPSRTYLAGQAMVVTHNSEMLVMGPLNYVHHERYRAVLFRRTFKELEGSLIDRSWTYYPHFGARYSQQKHTWFFPSGARVIFSHLEHERDVFAHQSAEYQYIGFDELTSFSEFQYRYMLSRARGSHGIPIEIRAATNPEPNWVLRRWAPWVDRSPTYLDEVERGSALLANSGDVLWYVSDEDAGVERYVAPGTPGALTRCFVRARLEDNPTIAVKDPDYRSRLAALDPVQRARLRDGDWAAAYAAGLLFKRAWFPVVETTSSSTSIARVRWWDLAGSESTEDSDPDWTVGLLYSYDHRTKLYCVEDVVRKRGRPAEIEALIRHTAREDAAKFGNTVLIALPQDPGQAGKYQRDDLVTKLAAYPVKSYRETGSKVARSGPVSGQAENGFVRVLRATWNEGFFYELEAFPSTAKDDQVDALSGAHMAIQGWTAVAEAGSGGHPRDAVDLGGF